MDWSWLNPTIDPCLDVRSLNYRADVIKPVAGPALVIQRATFTVQDTTLCEGDDANLALFVVFVSPGKDNKTYLYSQRTMKWLKADQYEAVIESTQWFEAGIHSVQIQVRDTKKNKIVRMTNIKEMELSMI